MFLDRNACFKGVFSWQERIWPRLEYEKVEERQTTKEVELNEWMNKTEHKREKKNGEGRE